MDVKELLKQENPELYSKLESLALRSEVVNTIETILLKHFILSTKQEVIDKINKSFDQNIHSTCYDSILGMGSTIEGKDDFIKDIETLL